MRDVPLFHSLEHLEAHCRVGLISIVLSQGIGRESQGKGESQGKFQVVGGAIKALTRLIIHRHSSWCPKQSNNIKDQQFKTRNNAKITKM